MCVPLFLSVYILPYLGNFGSNFNQTWYTLGEREKRKANAYKKFQETSSSPPIP